MKIALINAPVSVRSPHSRLAPPLGLAYIASTLLAHGFSVSAVDYNISGLNLNRVDRLIEVDRPALIGISAHTETYPNALRIAKRLKERDPQTKIIMGGSHPSLLPSEVLGETAIDFVCLGQGEITMLELSQTLAEGKDDFSGILGLGYKKQGEIVLNPKRRLVNPDTLPHPARELFPLDFYSDQWNVLTAIGGCPFACPFCSASQIWGGQRRARTPENIVEEVQLLMDRYGAEYIFFSDDIFTVDKSWVYQLVALLRRLPAPLSWGCSTRVDMVDPMLIKAMAESGCLAIHFGVESGAQEVLDSVKGIKKEEVLSAISSVHSQGIKTTSSFMIPFPQDSVETIRETKKFIRQVRDEGSKVLLSFTTPFPGTYFYEHSAELGLKIHATSWEEYDTKHNILETARLTLADIDSMVQEIVEDLGMSKVV